MTMKPKFEDLPQDIQEFLLLMESKGLEGISNKFVDLAEQTKQRMGCSNDFAMGFQLAILITQMAGIEKFSEFVPKTIKMPF